MGGGHSGADRPKSGKYGCSSRSRRVHPPHKKTTKLVSRNTQKSREEFFQKTRKKIANKSIGKKLQKKVFYKKKFLQKNFFYQKKFLAERSEAKIFTKQFFKKKLQKKFFTKKSFLQKKVTKKFFTKKSFLQKKFLAERSEAKKKIFGSFGYFC